jgi:virulence-associated protein VagC
MTTSHPSRLFASGTANTLYATIPAQLVTDSQFPFDADDLVTVTIDGDRLIITPNTREETAQ